MKKRVNIAIDEKVHTKAKVIAVLKGVTLNQYLKEAIENEVAKEKKLLENIK